ncbi:MAG: tRNA (adenosine(37)-N6)-threonylcarbamoyltransferase complex ATPase subunit type 1 TsaE [Candidatus Portnoybacteria bacterium RBG_19FT_COMBO_36_7]|uniref:tRNA threonylcarbamoyladenosine biosynthesis protein TsaE n=1 Tax=Candidatus Portnoybacteria bacterium RBG_19FT_COMBO_36_7 TaxID=1801992 RepID=A0A1G2F6N9_9BACT|nr:MAG: tRNA (adenosine(37)-N6)-threonylcarbamoyltransferase complex ATPase subunit type 1 TsaE [Candidatus Moranbacteria bacterium RBG_19FT_COMBO_42_6]OGZ33587.1 MAG: tRNA (adenosine(37)-N6)-threonylcarbamoyltransferase complex ATPase subunit type 1 TsaE [Candidatus Portnoybacteria bacterium RBG_19FT_COMBO_36_7]
MKKLEYLSKSAAQTQKLAGEVLKETLSIKKRKNGIVLALEGELGGGKTTFVQGLARALGVKEKITSPTFVILKRFMIQDSRFKNLYHIDCYRLDNIEDLADLGFEEIIKNPENLVVIEWADKIKSIIPKDAVWVKFEWKEEKKRKIMMDNSQYPILNFQ